MTTDSSAEKTIVLVSDSGNEYHISEGAARGSRLIADVLEGNPTSEEAIPLTGIPDEDIARVLQFLNAAHANKTEAPFNRMTRVPKSGEPVPDTGYANPTDLRLSAGIPAWANNLIVRGDVNNGDESAPTLDLISVLNLAEAATVMGIKMLIFLATGRIAQVVSMIGVERVSFMVGLKLTPEQQREIKEQNPFGWKEETKPIVADGVGGAAEEASASSEAGSAAGAAAGAVAGATMA